MTEAQYALGVDGELRTLNDAGLLDGADAVVTQRIAAAVGETDRHAVLALAFAVRAVREGSTALDLASVAELHPVSGPDDDPDVVEGRTAGQLIDLPEPDAWLASVAGSRLATAGVLRADLGLVYLDRYHRDECLIADALRLRRTLSPAPLEVSDDRLPADLTAEQRAAVASVATRTLTVLTGGPGTGKTHTIAGVLSALRDAAGPELRVALAAPTGKAAARMTESLETQNGDSSALQATTIHRLLGFLPGSRGRFRHHAGNPLPHDLVVIDEASMVSLSLMARVVEALPPTCRLLLVGDPDQLASVEAGSVLADLVRGLRDSGEVVALTRDHRLGGDRADLARAFRSGEPDAVLRAVDGAGDSVTMIDTDAPTAQDLGPSVDHARELREAAVAGDVDRALLLLGRSRLLCAHRSGPFGTRRWNRLIEQALSEDHPEITHQPMYLGRPVLVTRNDYALGVFNGDTGVIVRGDDGRPVAVFETAAGRRELSPWRLSDIETMHAMTVHKAQGSQAARVTVVVPPIDSPLLTRELLYTAVTRAQEHLTVVGSRAAVLEAAATPVHRSSGLASRLTPGGGVHTGEHGG